MPFSSKVKINFLQKVRDKIRLQMSNLFFTTDTSSSSCTSIPRLHLKNSSKQIL